MSIESLYEKIKRNLSAEYLKELSIRIIDAYRSRNLKTLTAYALHVMPESVDEHTPPNRVFLRLIGHFHPDRLAAIRKEVADAYASGDKKVLAFYAKLAEAKDVVESSHHASREPVDLREEYDYGTEDFGYDIGDQYEEEVESDYEEAETEFDFIRAVKAEHLGNLDVELTPADLSYLEGELVLAGYELSDLDGLEYCTNLTSLDLSKNQIDNIYEVQFLTHLHELFLARNHISSLTPLADLAELEILDLADNDIEDPSPLLSMAGLRFVNLQGNPLEETETLRLLEERSIAVIF